MKSSVSGGADSTSDAAAARWARLDRAAGEAAAALERWRGRALEAEEEVLRLRGSLESLAGRPDEDQDLAQQLKAVRAENAALHSRMLQARKRLAALSQRLDALGIDDD